jgi:membrane-bound inhibitor of C-type lysozyme
MAGGSGAKYAADTIVFLSKSKEKDADKNVIGNVITRDRHQVSYDEGRTQSRDAHHV